MLIFINFLLMKYRRALLSTIYKNKQWSAPAVMMIIFLSGMLMIFSLESLGLIHENTDIELRQFVYVPSKPITTPPSNKDNLVINDSLLEKSKEERVLKIYNILIEGAIENYNNSKKNCDLILSDDANNC